MGLEEIALRRLVVDWSIVLVLSVLSVVILRVFCTKALCLVATTRAFQNQK